MVILAAGRRRITSKLTKSKCACSTGFTVPVETLEQSWHTFSEPQYEPMELMMWWQWQNQVQELEFKYANDDIYSDFGSFEASFPCYHENRDNTIRKVAPLNAVIMDGSDDSGGNGSCIEIPTGITGAMVESSSSSSSTQQQKRFGRSKSISIDLEDIKRHFKVPITKAAKEMKVGLTVLKKRCRELQIKRWPHRKIKSLSSLIHNVKNRECEKELGMTEEIQKLEEHKREMEKLPQMALTEKTKKLRQVCFKAKYKMRRSLAAAAAAVATD
ncbi:PREDICTED: protein RKD4-like [Nelumbo nucifera]|uniref:Protein RKD4-like n=1 Tax=Nelumbo nucifera TaxID=4432 RepID=A0A1U8Q8K1_NELNU|nr:PREDICTED: protein RKD4-like [Nelumbo nucifera]